MSPRSKIWDHWVFIPHDTCEFGCNISILQVGKWSQREARWLAHDHRVNVRARTETLEYVAPQPLLKLLSSLIGAPLCKWDQRTQSFWLGFCVMLQVLIAYLAFSYNLVRYMERNQKSAVYFAFHEGHETPDLLFRLKLFLFIMFNRIWINGMPCTFLSRGCPFERKYRFKSFNKNILEEEVCRLGWVKHLQ